MMIDIYGAGMAGCFFASLLEKEGLSYNLYEKVRKTKCPSKCAFGWANYSKVKELCKLIDVDSDEYVLVRPKKAIVNGIELKIRDVVIFDKPRFINDLRNRLMILYNIPSHFIGDLIVDATGHNRALFDDSKYVTRLKTRQAKVKLPDFDENCIYIYAKRFGYAWAFPLDDKWWHLGAGAFTNSQVSFLLEGFGTFYDVKTPLELDCQCKSPIIWDYGIPFWRMIMTPEAIHYIVAIGEAGGFVSAFGEGNTLALETAKCLYDAILYSIDYSERSRGERKPDCCEIVIKYEELVTKETAWLEPQYDFVKTLNKSWFEALFKLPRVLKIANRRNLDVSIWGGLKLLWRVR